MSTLLRQLLGAGIMATLASGSYGAILIFDGADDHVNAGASVALKMTNRMTLEAWIMPAGPNTTGVILGREGEYLLTRFTDGTIQYAVYVTGPGWNYINTGVTAPLNQWMHLALTCDANATGNRIRFYTNGVLAFSGPGSGNLLDAFPTQNDFRIGSRQAVTTQSFRGQIDDVRVWNIARSPAEISNWMNRPLIGNEPGLVAYYRMDEGAGTVTLDRTGHGLGGTLVGGAAWNLLEESLDQPIAGGTTVSAVTDTSAILHSAVNTNGVPTTNRFEWNAGSTALEFDGIDDLVIVQNGPNLANRSFSIEFWARRDGTNVYAFPLSLGGAGTSRDLLHVGFRSPTVMTFGFFADDLDATASGDDFAWHHWAFTYNSTNRQRRIYQDGLLVGQDIAGGHFIGVGPLRLGRYIASNLQTAFAGAVDEVRVWKDAVLTETTIRQWMSAEVNNTHTNFNSLEAYWKLNEGASRTIADGAGHGFNGEFVDNPAWAPGARPVFDMATLSQTVSVSNQVLNVEATLNSLTPATVYHVRAVAEGANGQSTGRSERFATLALVRGTALVFDGQDDYVRVSGFGPQAPTTEVTVEFWQRVHSLRQQSPFSLEPDTGGNRFQVNSPWTDGVVYWDFGDFSGAGRLAYTPPESLVGQWNHFAFVASQAGRFMRIYRNGVLEAQKATNDTREVGSFDLLLGRGTLGGAPRYFDGELDEFRIWNIARTELEIQRDLNARLSGNEPGLVSYYRMDEGAAPVLVDASTNGRNGLITGSAYVGSTAPVGVPVAMTLPATLVGFGNATLNGRVNGDGALPSRFWFEYGTQGNLNLTTLTQSLSVAASVEVVNVNLSNLQGGVIHTFRLVAANDNGTNYGAVQSFVMPFPASAYALQFDGTNYVNLGSSPLLNATIALSVEAWIYPTGPGDIPGGGIIVNKEGEYEFARFADGTLRWAIANTSPGWTFVNTTIIAPSNQWMHVAFTYDRSAMRLYTNGALASTIGATGNIGDAVPALDELWIGARQGGGQRFQGRIDEVRIWGTTRTGSDIAGNYNRLLTGTEPGLLAYLHFDEGGGTNTLDSGPNHFVGTLVGNPAFVASGAPPTNPLVTTLAPSPVLATSATLRGTVNPSGTDTGTYFEYGETAAYGTKASLQSHPGSLATLSLSAPLTGLEPGTIYHYRMVAYNTLRTNYGMNQTFTTLVLGSGWPVSTKLTGGEASSPLHVLDGLGNTYVAGIFSGSAAFRSALSPQGGAKTNAFVGKMSRSADWLWAVNVPCSSNGFTSIKAIALDTDRNVYLAGQFSGTNTFGTASLIAATNDTNFFVAKLDSFGTNWLWAKSAGGIGPDSANAITVVGTNVFVAGNFSGTNNLALSNLVSVGGSDIFVASLDTDGNWLWAARGGGTSNDFVNTMATDASTNIYVAGQYSGTMTNGTTTLTNAGGTDLFVGKLTGTGAWLLAQRGGGANNDVATALTRDTANQNQFYLVGQFGGTADYGGIPNLNPGNVTNIFVLKFNSEAAYQNYIQGGAGLARSVTVDGLGQVYVAGEFPFTVSFGTNSLTSFGNSDVFLAQLVGREWTWAKQIGSAGRETAGSISADADNSVVISGTYQGTIDVGYVALSSPNNQDIFVARLDANRVYEHNNYTIGQPIPVPVDAQDPAYGDGAIAPPSITILESQQRESTPDNSFVWGDAEHKLFPVREVTAIFKWRLTTNPTNITSVITAVGRTHFPTNPQVHVAGAPVELEPGVAGFPLRYFNRAFTTANGDVDAGSKVFTAPTNGWTVLQFLSTGGMEPNSKIHPSLFEVVQTVLWNDPSHLDDNQPALIGEALTRHEHNDLTGKNGYVYFERACYDGVGEQRAYDRPTRTGPIIPVNRDTTASDDDLVVVWYRPSAVTGIAWPDDPVRYLAHWPSNATELVIASDAGSGLLDSLSFPGKRVYNQPDDRLPGFNPNEEHAALYGDVLYALRNDLNTTIKASEPYTLLKYRNPADNQWAMKVFHVVATNSIFQFAYSSEAGQQLPLPPPLGFISLCGVSNTWISGPAYQDHLGRLYARAAGLTNPSATIVARYWYPLQPGFFYDLDRDGEPNAQVGDCVPWLDGSSGVPIDVTYEINWPTTIPVLEIGETLLGDKFSPLDVRNLARAKVIFDQGDPSGTNGMESIVRLFDPLTARTVQLRPNGSTNFVSRPGYTVFRTPDANAVFNGIATANQTGMLVFTDLPFALRSRLRYDPLKKDLVFVGLLDESADYGGPNNPLLLPNVLSPRERDRIQKLGGDNFDALINAVYDLTRNPNRLDLDRNGSADAAFLVGLTTNQLGVVPEDLGDGPKVLSAGGARTSGFITLIENDHPSLAGLPVKLHILRVDQGPFRGDVKVIQSDNVFDEKLTLRHSADFGGEPQRFEFEWFYRPVQLNTDPTLFPTVLPSGDIDDLRGWTNYSVDPDPSRGRIGVNDITLGDDGESSLLVLADNYFICRYRGYVINGQTNWSDWVGAIGGEEAQLAEGWVKRVRDGLNPFEARTTNFHSSETVTFASMLQQAGPRYERDISFNPGGGSINSIGLIEAYETVLRRARHLSIDASPGINYQPANDALLLAAGFIADLYLLLGNEAAADAADPTIGFRTASAGYGTLAPSIFSFQNQLDSLLEEELALLRGRDDRSATVRLPPVYNRLFWNFTRDEGEVAYAQAYNITDQNGDGFIDAADARIMYPQAHGDAWGHYLTATKTYYSLLQNPNFDWIPRSEPILLAGVRVNVDYLDERKFARAAAAKARTGAELVDLTYRLNYVDDPSGQYQGYKDTDPERAWGVSEWAQRAGSAAFFDWVVGNAVLPATDPNTNHTGLTKIDRTTVSELDEILAGYESVQAQVDKADAGLNPLGLAKNAVPFDIDPSLISAGKTHFEQIYDRAIESVRNTVTVFDHANQLSQALRSLQDTVNDFSRNVGNQERDYKNRLIEVFGYPYTGDIGAGKTYPSGYDGPDIYHYMYVNAVELNGETAPPGQTLTAFYARLDGNSHYFRDDLPALINTNLATAEILQVSYPSSTADFAFVAPGAWAQRRAPGEVQMALSELLQSEARLKQALINYDNLLKEIDDQLDLLEARYQVRTNTIEIRNTAKNVTSRLANFIGGSRIARGIIKGITDSIRDTSNIVIEGLPKVAGAAVDVTAPIRGTIKAGSNLASKGLKIFSGFQEILEGLAQARIDATKDQAQWDILTEQYNFQVQQHLKEIEQLIRKETVLRAEAFGLSEKVNQAGGRYQAALAKGLRLLEERTAFRKNAAAETQASRYQDMTFRIFRNDAIQKYRAQFDLAAQYVFLAAVAYDFETQLLGGRPGAGRAFLTDIVRQRALGEVVNGVPVAGRHGLADPLARLNQNFGVLKGQLGFNNPQTETGRFSLRRELFRIGDGSDESWRAELKNRIVPNLWDIPEFRRYCRPFAPESAGAQPGLVIRFPTTVTFSLNYFGFPLGGGDSAYDSTLFATKVRSAGIWFSNYLGSGLSVTPRVYLVPVGADVMRSPSGNNLETREWRVVDQKIPVPFPIGFSSLNNPAWIPMNDSLSDTFADIRRFSSFRAFHDKGTFDPAETISDSRLIGRSVWNTDWMLIIPGGTFLFDPNQGLDTFINSVSDIKIFFQTYAYSGN